VIAPSSGAAPVAHRVYLVPGMFGFGTLAGYEYFGHLAEAISARFAEAGVPVVIEVISTPPTASMRRRAAVVATTIAASSGAEPGAGSGASVGGPIHLVGHSTGGLDARLVTSPTTNLGVPSEALSWRSRARSVVTLNTPHYGTPLAAFFTTVAGTRLLYAISLLTVTTLSIGAPPLSAFSSLLAAIASVDDALGIDVHLVDRATDLVLRFIGERGRGEVHEWLDEIRQDQGGIVQITPEAMDVFNAATEDGPGIFYASLASAAPPPRPVRLASRIRSPYAALSATLFSTLYKVVARAPERYPYATATPAAAELVHAGVEHELDSAMNDGIVPTASMLWGELVWAGKGDHLDVVGHFRDDSGDAHVDWLASGANFGRYRFRTMTDAIARVLLREETPDPDDRTSGIGP